MGGLVTWANSCLNYSSRQGLWRDKHASGVSLPMDRRASFREYACVIGSTWEWIEPQTPGTRVLTLNPSAKGQLPLTNNALTKWQLLAYNNLRSNCECTMSCQHSDYCLESDLISQGTLCTTDAPCNEHCVTVLIGLNIFYSWQNMTKDWAEQKSYVKQLFCSAQSFVMFCQE